MGDVHRKKRELVDHLGALSEARRTLRTRPATARAAREQLGLSQREIAVTLGVERWRCPPDGGSVGQPNASVATALRATWSSLRKVGGR